MNEYTLMLMLVALALIYASVLIVVRLDSLGVARRRIYTLLAELWGAFASIILFFTLINRLIGRIPRSSIAGELTEQLARLRHLPVLQQLIVYGALAVSVLLIIHTFWTLREAQRTGPVEITDGGTEE